MASVSRPPEGSWTDVLCIGVSFEASRPALEQPSDTVFLLV